MPQHTCGLILGLSRNYRRSPFSTSSLVSTLKLYPKVNVQEEAQSDFPSNAKLAFVSTKSNHTMACSMTFASTPQHALYAPSSQHKTELIQCAVQLWLWCIFSIMWFEILWSSCSPHRTHYFRLISKNPNIPQRFPSAPSIATSKSSLEEIISDNVTSLQQIKKNWSMAPTKIGAKKTGSPVLAQKRWKDW